MVLGTYNPYKEVAEKKINQNYSTTPANAHTAYLTHNIKVYDL